MKKYFLSYSTLMCVIVSMHASQVELKRQHKECIRECALQDDDQPGLVVPHSGSSVAPARPVNTWAPALFGSASQQTQVHAFDPDARSKQILESSLTTEEKAIALGKEVEIKKQKLAHEIEIKRRKNEIQKKIYRNLRISHHERPPYILLSAILCAHEPRLDPSFAYFFLLGKEHRIITQKFIDHYDKHRTIFLSKQEEEAFAKDINNEVLLSPRTYYFHCINMKDSQAVLYTPLDPATRVEVEYLLKVEDKQAEIKEKLSKHISPSPELEMLIEQELKKEAKPLLRATLSQHLPDDPRLRDQAQLKLLYRDAYTCYKNHKKKGHSIVKK